MIGTNRELRSIQRLLDRRISELTQAARRLPDQDRTSDNLTALVSNRTAISAILANRRIEAAKKVVDLTQWFTGNSALSGGPPGRATFENP